MAQISQISSESQITIFFKDMGAQISWKTNCSYYWGFAAYIAYCNNNVNYSPPCTHLNVFVDFGRVQLYGGLGFFLVVVTLRVERKIPFPTGNVFTSLFNLVSCPNYFYEYISWLSFAVASQSLPCLMCG
ncbi:probable very-long-chain enoyl-CoA reductase art-1 [Octopus sinensis]|uniref:Probable very-long-chain enoyl-CoA reductase art-1 n=1 Tax=Octopus sinensis TaxID=2607531 RepID=A0A6P7TP84_9MOLL|nr:probable very-long-chain enoyl-CoA reductase art-1 [Octopus sinensis]